jgi:TatD DNase family protein
VDSLFDTHCHLTLGALKQDGAMAWERAQASGISNALVVGIDAETSREVVDFVRDRRGLFASVGIHPNETSKVLPGDFQTIEALTKEPKVVAIGETGLDLYWKDSPLDVQVRGLLDHTELSLRTGLPLILHIRDAFAQAASALSDFAKQGGSAVLHCFTGGPKELHPFVEWGFAVSFSGILTYPKADALREAACLVPEHLLLLETDSPWLPPTPHRGKRNEPAFVVHTAAALAAVRGISNSDVAAITTANALRVFGLQPT